MSTNIAVMVERVKHDKDKQNVYYRVNIEYILEALYWLKENNPYYRYIKIDEKRYDYLNKDSTIFDIQGAHIMNRREEKEVELTEQEDTKVNTLLQEEQENIEFKDGEAPIWSTF